MEAFRYGRGYCELCKALTLAKCGTRIVHHWAHENRNDCDSWSENETLWHREWKNLFPEECREICLAAPDGEIHRADIRTLTGIFIEIQHSPITDAERLSRETFYQNLVWIVDGKNFRKNFDIYHALPDPSSDLAADIVWLEALRGMKGGEGGMFFRMSEVLQRHPHATKTNLGGGLHLLHTLREIETELMQSHYVHYQYDWVRPHTTWLEATCPVYIDFGGEELIKLETYDESGLKCIRKIPKVDFIQAVKTESSVVCLGTRGRF